MSRIYLGGGDAEGSTFDIREISLRVYEFPSVDDLVKQLQHAEPGISAPEVNADTGHSVKWKQYREHIVQADGMDNIISPDGKFLVIL